MRQLSASATRGGELPLAVQSSRRGGGEGISARTHLVPQLPQEDLLRGTGCYAIKIPLFSATKLRVAGNLERARSLDEGGF